MRRLLLAFALFLTICAGLTGVLWAKGKSRHLLPSYVLTARTVAVIIDPSAGVSADDPNANQAARDNVEEALSHWGRFEPVTREDQADLLIVIRRGSGKLANETVTNPRQNSRAGSISPDGSAVEIGGARGHDTPNLDGTLPGGTQNGTNPAAHPQVEVGAVNDQFTVYQGHTEVPLDDAPAWRWNHKDGLHPPDVIAVEEFRKAIAETEEAAAQQKKKP